MLSDDLTDTGYVQGNTKRKKRRGRMWANNVVYLPNKCRAMTLHAQPSPNWRGVDSHRSESRRLSMRTESIQARWAGWMEYALEKAR